MRRRAPLLAWAAVLACARASTHHADNSIVSAVKRVEKPDHQCSSAESWGEVQRLLRDGDVLTLPGAADAFVGDVTSGFVTVKCWQEGVRVPDLGSRDVWEVSATFPRGVCPIPKVPEAKCRIEQAYSLSDDLLLSPAAPRFWFYIFLVCTVVFLSAVVSALTVGCFSLTEEDLQLYEKRRPGSRHQCDRLRGQLKHQNRLLCTLLISAPPRAPHPSPSHGPAAAAPGNLHARRPSIPMCRHSQLDSQSRLAGPPRPARPAARVAPPLDQSRHHLRRDAAAGRDHPEISHRTRPRPKIRSRDPIPGSDPEIRSRDPIPRSH